MSGPAPVAPDEAHAPAPPRTAASPDRLASALMVIAGLAGIVQLVVPWFTSRTGWDLYYHADIDGFTDTVSAYTILVALIAGILILLAGIAQYASPPHAVVLAKAARAASIVILVCVAWWIAVGPLPFADMLAQGRAGWYLVIIAGLAGLIGAGKRLAGPQTTFDRISFMAIFLGLPLVIFIVFVISPFIQAIYYSLTDWGGFSPEKNFVGLDNYAKLLTDDKFRKALVNCIELGIVVPLVTIGIALAIASMVTVGGPPQGPVRGIKNSSFYRVVSFFPYVVPQIVIGLIWAQVYAPNSGIFNGILGLFGIDSAQGFGWLVRTSTAMPASMFVIIWSFIGFYTVLFVAAIKGVSAEVYEASKLDGAGRFRTAISVTIPLIRDTIQTAYIYIGIAALDSFVYMAALNPNGGPGFSTLTITQELFQTAFKKSQFGYATSMGVVLAIMTLLFASIVFLVNRYAGTGRWRQHRLGRKQQELTIAVAAHPVATSQGV